ncbi:MAG: hypothetical protein C0417_05235 [Chlorobiaceae bacterium]|nr:hypothetical protein [Chlorobiaceae bacterium]
MFIMLVILEVLLGIGILYVNISKGPSKQKQKFNTILIPIFCVILGYILSVNKPVEMPPEYAKLNSPVIEPELVINEVDGMGFYFSFIIKNEGNLPAENINFLFKTPGVAGVEVIPSIKRTLSPRSSMAYKPSPIKTKFERNENYYVFRLLISYDATINGELKKYYGIFRWILSKQEMKEKSYRYEDANRQEGVFKESDISELFSNQQIVTNVLANLPGYSFGMVINIKDTSLNREKYILDLGHNINSDRISIYLSNNNDLNFRIIDSASNIYELTAQINQYAFKFNVPFILMCEFGKTDGFSFLRMLINGSEIERKLIHSEINISLSDKLLETLTLGGDIKNNNGGFFSFAEFTIYGGTLSTNDLNRLGTYFERSNKDKWICFNGESIMKRGKLIK